MYPQLYWKAKTTIANMTKADYLFLISYPTYSGYRIEHDPLYTIYFTPVAAFNPNLGGVIVIAAIAGAAIAVAIVIVRKRSQKRLVYATTKESSPAT
jgi:hypothetical protein